MIYTKTVNHQITTNVQLILFDVDKSGVFFQVTNKISLGSSEGLKFLCQHLDGYEIYNRWPQFSSPAYMRKNAQPVKTCQQV